MAKRNLQATIREHLTFGLVGKRPKDSIRFLSLALAGEAGELANVAKKEWRGDRKFKGKKGQETFRLKIEEETVDLGNYVFMMAERLGIDLPKRMLAKLIEVEQRDDDWNKVVKSRGKKRPVFITYKRRAKKHKAPPIGEMLGIRRARRGKSSRDPSPF